MNASENCSLSIDQHNIRVIGIAETGEVFPGLLAVVDENECILLVLGDAAAHAMSDHAPHHFWSILQNGDAEETQTGAAAKFLSQLPSPSLRGISAGSRETDVEYCRMAQGCIRQRDLVFGERVRLNVRNALCGDRSAEEARD